MKSNQLVFVVACLSFFALGLPDGALGVAWPHIRHEMSLPLDRVNVLFLIHSVFFAAASGLIGRMSAFLRLEHINQLGIVLMAVGFFGYSIAPSFAVLALMTVLTGSGMAMIDASNNAYSSKNFSSSANIFLSCAWGLGAAVSPIVISRFILMLNWRAGYVSVAAIQSGVAVVALVSLLRGVWREEENRIALNEQVTLEQGFLSKKRYQFLNVFIFFLYVGAEHSSGFWVTSVLLESRGMDIGAAAAFPAVYYASIMAGRFIFGYLAKRFSNIFLVRFGLALATAGLLIMSVSNSLFGMSLIGLGFAPVHPCTMHQTSKRFGPLITTKLVGYQVAAGGLGVALLSSLVGIILTRVSLEALFLVVFIFAVLTFLINELLERKCSRL